MDLIFSENLQDIQFSKLGFKYRMTSYEGSTILAISLEDTTKYANFNYKELILSHSLILKKLLGKDFYLIYGIIHSCDLNVFLLIDFNMIKNNLDESEQIAITPCLVEPIFIENINKCFEKCISNNYEEGIIVDPVSHEPLDKDNMITIGSACYNISTIIDIVNKGNRTDPLTREPLSNEIIERFLIKRQDHVIIRGTLYEIEDNTLDLSFKGITDEDLHLLSNLTFLETLFLCNNHITDISPLSSLTSLENLDLSNNQITNISPLSYLIRLNIINLSYNQIIDILPLLSLRSLTYLSVCNNQIREIPNLSSLIQLNNINLSNNQIRDISPLSSLTSLKLLNLSNNQIVDISPLSSLTSLKLLNLGNNEIRDISPLLNLQILDNLHLNNNQITDITPLLSLSSLKYLHIKGNNLSNASALSSLSLQQLDIGNTSHLFRLF